MTVPYRTVPLSVVPYHSLHAGVELGPEYMQWTNDDQKLDQMAFQLKVGVLKFEDKKISEDVLMRYIKNYDPDGRTWDAAQFATTRPDWKDMDRPTRRLILETYCTEKGLPEPTPEAAQGPPMMLPATIRVPKRTETEPVVTAVADTEPAATVVATPATETEIKARLNSKFAKSLGARRGPISKQQQQQQQQVKLPNPEPPTEPRPPTPPTVEPTTTTTTTTQAAATARDKTPPPLAPLRRVLPGVLPGAVQAGDVGTMAAKASDHPNTCSYEYSSAYKCIAKDFKVPPPLTQCDTCHRAPNVHHLCFIDAAPNAEEGSQRQCCVCLTADIAEDALFSAPIDCDKPT